MSTTFVASLIVSSRSAISTLESKSRADMVDHRPDVVAGMEAKIDHGLSRRRDHIVLYAGAEHGG